MAVIEKMDEAMTVLEKFMKENSSETMKLFFPSQPVTTKVSVRCPVEEQKALCNKLYKLSEVVSKLNKYLIRADEDDNEKRLARKLQTFVSKNHSF
jgi:hypothetical protein